MEAYADADWTYPERSAVEQVAMADEMVTAEMVAPPFEERYTIFVLAMATCCPSELTPVFKVEKVDVVSVVVVNGVYVMASVSMPALAPIATDALACAVWPALAPIAMVLYPCAVCPAFRPIAKEDAPPFTFAALVPMLTVWVELDNVYTTTPVWAADKVFAIPVITMIVASGDRVVEDTEDNVVGNKVAYHMLPNVYDTNTPFAVDTAMYCPVDDMDVDVMGYPVV